MTTPSLPSSEEAPATGPTDRSPEGRPSPLWYGGVSVGLLWAITTIVLSYTLLDISWQQRLGGWNYVVAVALIPVMAIMMRRWRPNTDRNYSTITTSRITSAPASRPEAGGSQQ